ncbi:hypothetical protein AYI72_00985 [Shewanella algae]|uniref:lipopolysaccharide biosynthesis protein n=1 Tax=Shewanella algae TaxID=38313 RepID=UPI00118370FC|nr:oligosaccharide flippase family protein [Shewanella algae]TVL09937.1 hypothetical protein AYI72_00985 [Shewanella algae]
MKKDAIIYLGANILNALTPFILIPILTRELSVSEYGVVALFQTLLPILTIFVGLNINGAIARKFYDDETDNDFGKYVFNAFVIGLISFIFITSIFYLSSRLFSDALQSSFPKDVVLLALTYAMFNVINQVRLVIWQVKQKPKPYATFQVIQSLGLLLSCLLLIYYMDIGPYSRIYSAIGTVFFFSLLSIVILIKRDELKFEVNRSKVKDILNFGLPLLPHSIGMIIVNTADRYFVNLYIGVDSLGLYMALIQVSLILGMFFDAINKAYVPWLFSKLRKNDPVVDKGIVKKTYIYMLSLIFIGIVLSFIAPYFFIVFVGEKYNSVASYISIIIWAQIFNGMYLLVTNYVFYTKKNGKLSVVTISTGALNLALLFLLVPEFGIKGAVYSTVISSFIRFVSTWCLAAKLRPMPWSVLSK